MDDYPHELLAGSYQSEDDVIGGGDHDQVRKGPWTVEEDAVLSDYINIHGEGRWNSAARCAGLNRTGKSCRLRWLNYLRPNVRRGNITLEEQLLILELHSRWGNRWSKIAQFLPGRTDNEIKNYWRTRVQKHAKQLKCDVNSKQFRDAMRYVWMPRLVERIQASSTGGSSGSGQPTNHSESPEFSMMPEPSVTTSSDSFDTEYQNPSKAGADETEGGNGELTMENFWNEENIWFLQQQLM